MMKGNIGFKRLLEVTYIPIVALLLITEAVTAPLRYYLSNVNLDIVSYLPKALSTIYVLVSISVKPQKQSTIIALALIIAATLNGVANGVTSEQVAFALFVFVPFFLGLTAHTAYRAKILIPNTLVFLLWAITVSGVWLDFSMELPWKGAETELLGKSVEINRAWGTFSIDRPAGFTRISAVASFFIAIPALIIISIHQGWMFRLSVISISIATIVITTNKSAVAGFIAALLIFSLREYRTLHKTSCYGLAIATIALPLSCLFIKYDLSLDDFYAVLLLASLDDRLTATWPDFMQAVGYKLLGVGLGGVGASVKLFGTGIAQTYLRVADSLPLYLVGLFGPVLGILVLLLFVRAVLAISNDSNLNAGLASCGVFIVAIGATTDCIEGVLISFLVGYIFSCKSFVTSFRVPPLKEEK